MRRRCIVPSCNFRRSNASDDRRSMFKCPKDSSIARKWADSIGIYELKQYHHVCETHFEPQFIHKYFEKGSQVCRSRLSRFAVPTIFDSSNGVDFNMPDTYPDYNVQYPVAAVPQFDTSSSSNFYDNSNKLPQHSADKFEVSQIELRDSSNTPRIENSMTSVVQDLLASQDLLMNIKKEEFAPEEASVKVEPIEDYTEKFNRERKSEMKKFTVYQYVKYNKVHLISLLPESWSIMLFPVNDEEVVSFSKECTVNENIGLLVMYEKNIVIYKNGKVHYSIHGKRLKDIDPFNSPKFPENIPNTETMLKIIKQFDEVKVCQGLLISEFDLNNDCAIFKDDLGVKRHLKCYLMTDAQQCDSCFSYKQSLMSNILNRSQVLTDIRFPYLNNNQTYCNKSSR